jgi:citrate lyase alpha subunit
MSTSTYTVSLRTRYATSGRTLKPASAAATRVLLTGKGADRTVVDNVLAALTPGQSLTVATEYGFADVRAN